MKKLTLLFLLLSLSFAGCEDKYPDLEDGVYAEFITNKGIFVAKLYNDQTPLTVANFVSLAEGTNTLVDSAYANKRYYDGLTFHRVIKDFMIQGGDPLGTGGGSPGYRFPDEFVDSLKHSKKGLLSMANSGPVTNGSQFFVTLKETPWLDNKHTIFGEVVIGQEVVDSIGGVPTSKPGDKPVDPVIMEEVNIINKGNIKVISFVDQMTNMEKEAQEKAERIQRIAINKSVEFASLRENAEELPSGLKIHYLKRTRQPKPEEGTKILMNYAGYFVNGKLFQTNILEVDEHFENVDEGRKAAGQYIPASTTYSKDAQLVAGFKEGLLSMNYGEKVLLFIPAHLGYGEGGYPPLIPGNQDLVFELELVGPDEGQK